MGMDFKGLEKFTGDFKELQKQHEKWIRNFLMEEGMKVLRDTKKLTPVDTGNLRNRWELSDVYRRGDELYVVLFNPAIYASFVEEGHIQRKRFLPGKFVKGKFRYIKGHKGGIMLRNRWVPGKFMALISINKAERIIPKRYEKALKQFVKNLGVGD